jgi:hypothetical protein
MKKAFRNFLLVIGILLLSGFANHSPNLYSPIGENLNDSGNVSSAYLHNKSLDRHQNTDTAVDYDVLPKANKFFCEVFDREEQDEELKDNTAFVSNDSFYTVFFYALYLGQLSHALQKKDLLHSNLFSGTTAFKRHIRFQVFRI